MVSRVKGSSFKREDDREKLKKEGDLKKIIYLFIFNLLEANYFTIS